MARIAATMVLLSAVFWFASWPPIPLGKEFPNCVSARYDGSACAIGVLSTHHLSTLFITRQSIEPGRAVWSERADYHFCGFPVPTANWGVPGVALVVCITPSTIGWDCPYWLMTGLWTLVAARSLRMWQFRVGDLIYIATLVALVISLIQLRVALPLVAFLNLATVAMCLMLVVGTVRWFWRTPTPLWPVRVPVADESGTSQSPKASS